ncbi:MAG: PAS domain S-box protein [Bacteroidetes bacterium]|nr:PAS domain S-box protein [Bacteroidota bacterium]
MELHPDIEKTEASRNLYSTLFYKSPLMMVLTEAASGKIIEVNEQFIKFYGYEKEELIGKTLLRLNIMLHKQDHDDILRLVTKKGILHDREVMEKTKKGEIKWINASVSVLNLNGKKCLLGIGTDITEKKKYEEEFKMTTFRLEDSSNLFSSVFYKSPVLKAIADAATGKYIKVNDAFAEFCGFKKEELIGKTSLELNLIPNPRQREEIIKAVNKTGLVKDALIQARRKSGEHRWVSASVHKVNINGKDCFLSVMVDVDERKKAEEQIIRMNAELEKKVIDRTAELAKSEVQLRSFAEHLQTAQEEERARIAREIHDELGQQVVGIKIGLSSLKKFSTPENNLEEKINDLLKDADLTAQSLRRIATELRPGILDTLGLIPSIQWLVSEFGKKTGIKPSLLLHAKEQQYEKNLSTCFFRVCQEALTNIAKHAQASEVKIEIQHQALPPSGGDGGGLLILKISDNGKGMDSEKLKNPFSMGLLGMRERANIAGASLEIKSEQGKGTTVTLTARI